MVVGEGILAILCPEGVDMHRTIGRLCCDVLVQRIPSDALDVVAMFGDLAHKRARRGVVDARNVVHAANDEESGIGGPGKIVDFRAERPAHVLCSPCLLVFEAFVSERRVVSV